MIKLYGIKYCSSVKKGIEFLEAKKLDFEFLDIKKLSEKELDFFLSKKPFEVLINTAGMSARKLNINKDFIAKSSKDELKNIVLTNPSLIKRPVICLDDTVLVGKEYEQYFS